MYYHPRRSLQGISRATVSSLAPKYYHRGRSLQGGTRGINLSLEMFIPKTCDGLLRV